MNSKELIVKFARECGIAGLVVDDYSLIVPGNPMKISDLSPGSTCDGCVGYYINLEYPFKVSKPVEAGKFTIRESEAAVWVLDGKLLLALFPVYECHGVEIKRTLAIAHGHDSIAVINLMDLDESFTFYTR